MATFAFNSIVMEDARAAQLHSHTTISSELLGDEGQELSELHDLDADVLMEDSDQVPAKAVFNAWVQDLDEQTLPSLDNDELRILHALLFGSGDDAFSVADELLKQCAASQAA